MKQLFLLPLLALAAPASATSLADIAVSLKGTTSLSADFTQAGADGRVLAGKLWLARPGKVRFQYNTAKMLLVGDGRTLSFIDYEVKQVSQWPVRRTPLQILLAAEPDLAPIARITADTPDGVEVAARDPKRPEFGTLSIRFVRAASAPDGLALAGWTALDAQGGRSEVRLANVRYGASLAGVSFGFTDPRKDGPR
jgi:outer membrane lipoprotein-sorting protein